MKTLQKIRIPLRVPLHTTWGTHIPI